MRPTIVDVAALAGVSKSLVSLVLQGSPKVSEERRQAVLDAIEALGYRRNAVARSLVARRTEVFGVLVSDLHNPFFAEVVDGLQQAADALGYRTLLGTGHRDPAREAGVVESLLEMRVDGLVLLAPRLSRAALGGFSASVPTVVVGRGRKAGPHAGAVDVDHAAGAVLAVEHLAERGHRRIAHISGGSGAGARERREGYRRAMARLGRAEHVTVVSGGYTEDGGYAAARTLLAGPERPTAIFAANDLSAVGALGAIDEAGLRIPQDLSLVGFDNTALAALRHIALTSVNQPRVEMGRLAAEELHARVGDPSRPPGVHMLTPDLMIRGSTAAPG